MVLQIIVFLLLLEAEERVYVTKKEELVSKVNELFGLRNRRLDSADIAMHF